MPRPLVALSFAALVAACAQAVEPRNASTLGARPSDPEAAIRSYMELRLIDPRSAMYRKVGGPVPGHAKPPLIDGGARVHGWSYCYLVNARNRLGGYTGWQPWHFTFDGDHVAVAVQNPQLSA